MDYRISGDRLSLIVARAADGALHLTWFGRQSDEAMRSSARFQRLPASPDQPVGPVLMPEHGAGFHGIPQVEGQGAGTGRRTRLSSPQAEVVENRLIVRARDIESGLSVTSEFRFDGDALFVATSLENNGDEALVLVRAASAVLPAPDWADSVLTHSGAWGREGHEQRRRWPSGRVEQLGRGGRPGFDGGPTLTVCEARARVSQGRMLTAHLAWSGPFRLAAERASDGSGQILAERLFAPGECRLDPGQSLQLPEVVWALSDCGQNGLSDVFHSYVRRYSRLLKRPVHLNTWEARYFDVDEAGCIALAQDAASIGAERFVLDDGWFRGRRDDTSSLGDWQVDSGQFPRGLGPLIRAVHAAGMSFGLWVEPEMVSPDSDLYRAHPDWVLGAGDGVMPTGRNQLVLDLSRPDVRAYLYDQLAALLDAHPITYLKWDCNRDLYPATQDGVDRSGEQTRGLYTLLDRVRKNYPVEIESCASGGGRIDAGIARRVDRFWASDATDAVDRLRIQRAAGLVMPPERLGAHIGPGLNPMTGRQVPMAFRGLAALFCHLGIEADPGDFTAEDRAVLARVIALYKGHRDWLASGRLLQLTEAAEDPDAAMMVSQDGHQALVRVMRIATPDRPLQKRIQLAGLDDDSHYRVTEIALVGDPMLWPLGEMPGGGLVREGLAMDPGKALSGRIFHLERAD